MGLTQAVSYLKIVLDSRPYFFLSPSWSPFSTSSSPSTTGPRQLLQLLLQIQCGLRLQRHLLRWRWLRPAGQLNEERCRDRSHVLQAFSWACSRRLRPRPVLFACLAACAKRHRTACVRTATNWARSCRVFCSRPTQRRRTMRQHFSAPCPHAFLPLPSRTHG